MYICLKLKSERRWAKQVCVGSIMWSLLYLLQLRYFWGKDGVGRHYRVLKRWGGEGRRLFPGKTANSAEIHDLYTGCCLLGTWRGSMSLSPAGVASGWAGQRVLSPQQWQRTSGLITVSDSLKCIQSLSTRVSSYNTDRLLVIDT